MCINFIVDISISLQAEAKYVPGLVLPASYQLITYKVPARYRPNAAMTRSLRE